MPRQYFKEDVSLWRNVILSMYILFLAHSVVGGFNCWYIQYLCGAICTFHGFVWIHTVHIALVLDSVCYINNDTES